MKKAAFVILFFVVPLAIPLVSSAQTCDVNNGNEGQSACSPKCTGDQVCNFVGSAWQCIAGFSCTSDSQCAASRVCVGGSCKYYCPSGGGGTGSGGNGNGSGGSGIFSGSTNCPSFGYFYQGGNVQSCFTQGYSPNTSGSCLTSSQCGGNTCSLMTQGFCGCSGYRGGNPIQSCCQPANSSYFITSASAGILASCLGGSVSESNLGGPWRFMDISSLEQAGGDSGSSSINPGSGTVYILSFTCPNGNVITGFSAGLLAQRYENNPKFTADKMTFDEITAACAGGGGGNGGGSGGGGGGGGGNGGGGTTPGNPTSAYIQGVQKIINNIVNSYKAIINAINFGNTNVPPTVPPVNVNNFPTTITVNADVLNIRQAPNTQSTLLGQVLKGDIFTATGSVTGENVEGTDKWWQTSNNTYIWAGGTVEQ